MTVIDSSYETRERSAAPLVRRHDRLRVVHIETGAHWVGGPNQVLSLCRGLHERDVDSWLLCTPESPLGQKAEALGLKVGRLPIFGDLDPRLFLGAVAAIRRIQPDIVHLHSRRGADTWGALAARVAGVPRVVMSRRVDDYPGGGPIRRLKYGPWCDHIVAISEGIRSVLLDWGVPSDKVTCVRSAIDLAPYLRPADPRAFRERQNLPHDALLVATMAQLIHRKGHRVLIDAIPRIVAQVPNALFLFCGEGAERKKLEGIVRDRGLLSHVRFMGYVTDTPALLRAVDLVVHPALREGLGIAILEAMGLGKPVVASAVGGIPESIDPPSTGLLVPPGQPGPLADAITRFLLSPEMRRSVGEAAAARIRREFTIDAMVEGNLAIYERLLAETP